MCLILFPSPSCGKKISDNKVTQETRKTLLWSNIFLQQGHEFKRHIEQRHLKGIISSLILHLTDSGYKRKNSQNHCRKCLHSVSGDLPFPAVPPHYCQGSPRFKNSLSRGIRVGATVGRREQGKWFAQALLLVCHCERDPTYMTYKLLDYLIFFKATLALQLYFKKAA